MKSALLILLFRPPSLFPIKLYLRLPSLLRLVMITKSLLQGKLCSILIATSIAIRLNSVMLYVGIHLVINSITDILLPTFPTHLLLLFLVPTPTHHLIFLSLLSSTNNCSLFFKILPLRQVTSLPWPT